MVIEFWVILPLWPRSSCKGVGGCIYYKGGSKFNL